MAAITLRSALAFLVYWIAGCTGGVFVNYPIFPGQSCPSCMDDLTRGPDAPGR
jgi:hypothetical protein